MSANMKDPSKVRAIRRLMAVAVLAIGVVLVPARKAQATECAACFEASWAVFDDCMDGCSGGGCLEVCRNMMYAFRDECLAHCEP